MVDKTDKYLYIGDPIRILSDGSLLPTSTKVSGLIIKLGPTNEVTAIKKGKVLWQMK